MRRRSLSRLGDLGRFERDDNVGGLFASPLNGVSDDGGRRHFYGLYEKEMGDWFAFLYVLH